MKIRNLLAALLIPGSALASTIQFECEGQPFEDHDTLPLHSTFTFDLIDAKATIQIEDKNGLGFKKEFYSFTSDDRSLGRLKFISSGAGRWLNFAGEYYSDDDERLKHKLDLQFSLDEEKGAYRLYLDNHAVVLNDGHYRLCRDEGLCGESLISYYLDSAQDEEGKLAETRKKRMSKNICRMRHS